MNIEERIALATQEMKDHNLTPEESGDNFQKRPIIGVDYFAKPCEEVYLLQNANGTRKIVTLQQLLQTAELEQVESAFNQLNDGSSLMVLAEEKRTAEFLESTQWDILFFEF